MVAIDMAENWAFLDNKPHPRPFRMEGATRKKLVSLKPGEVKQAHNAILAPYFVVVLCGHGLVTAASGVEQPIGPNQLLVFHPGETYTVRALSELVYVGFVQPDTPSQA